MRKIVVSLVLLCLGAGFASAQGVAKNDTVKYSNKIVVTARYTGDAVALRWSAMNYPMWMAVRNAGIDIFRYEFNSNSGTLESEKKLTAVPLKPMSLERMKLTFKPTDTNAAMMAQVLYGKSQTNGGSTLESMDLMEADQGNRFTYATFLADLDPDLARAAAMGFLDKDIEKGKVYVYVLKSDIKNTMKYDLEESSTLVSTKEILPKEKLLSLDAIGFDKKVEVFWNRIEGESKFTAYEIERKEKNGTFRKMTNKPFLNPNNPDDPKDDEHIVFKDSIAVNYNPYTYRVRGINPFGERSEWVSVTVKGVDLTAPKAPEDISATYDPKSKSVRITWNKPIKEGDLAGYIVGRSENYEGPYAPISDKVYSANETQAIDLKPVSHLRNFYIVSAIDTTGNAGRSVPAYAILKDSIPPAKPIGLKAVIDSLGVVTLTWELGKEPDLAGYNVYRANSSHEEFSIINKSQVLDDKFIDMVDVNSLTKTTFYKIVAFDKTNNASEYSVPVKVIKPDYIPPVAPQITGFWVGEKHVKLSFMASNSTDLKEYQVFRKTDSANVRIATISKTDTLFVDTKLPAKNVLWYSIVAVDSAGLLSVPSFPQRVVMPNKGLSLPILKLDAQVTKSGVLLNWNKAATLPPGVRLMLYKAYGVAAVEQYKLLDYNGNFEDTDLTEEKIRYAARLVDGNGVMSELSQIIEVVFKR